MELAPWAFLILSTAALVWELTSSLRMRVIAVELLFHPSGKSVVEELPGGIVQVTVDGQIVKIVASRKLRNKEA